MSAVVNCEAGIFDCEYADAGDDAVCAYYNNEYVNMEGRVWIVIVAGIVMCAMCFGIGANDVANAWGTSVGSGALPLRTAVVLGAVGDFLGAVTLGHGVSDTIAKGVSDVTEQDCWACGYCDSKMSLYQVGMFSTLVGASFLLLMASFFSMPVSGTHASIGGVVGMTLLSIGGSCIDWSMDGLGAIFLSWVVSPALSGVIGAAMYLATERIVFQATLPRDRAITLLPWFFSSVTWVMLFLILVKSATTKALPLWVHLTSASAGGVVVLVGSIIFANPFIIKHMPGRVHGSEALDNSNVSDFDSTGKSDTSSSGMLYSLVNKSSDKSVDKNNPLLTADQRGQQESSRSLSCDMDAEKFRDSISSRGESDDLERVAQITDAMYCFKYLLVFNAFLESFAHGANDTANSTAPFSAVFSVYYHGEDACEKIAATEWTMIIAGCFVALGVITYGEKVITTVGESLTKIDFHKGFCIEFSSCATVVVATMLGLPVSTTHCQIGSVVCVGLVSAGHKNVSWGIFGKILVAWFVTVPVSGMVSAVMTSLIKIGM